jgi:hypothetical protein
MKTISSHSVFAPHYASASKPFAGESGNGFEAEILMLAFNAPINSTTVKRKGRPRSEDSLVFITVGLTKTQWAWLKLWFPTGSPTDALKALVERSIRFWPSGPFKFR